MFIDANVFIYAYDSKNGLKHQNSARLLKRIITGEQKASTSPLVINEVIFFFITNSGFEVARQIYKNMLSMQHLSILPVDRRVLDNVFAFMEQGLQVTDAFHAATMRVYGLQTACTYDKAFGQLKGITRQEPK